MKNCMALILACCVWAAGIARGAAQTIPIEFTGGLVWVKVDVGGQQRPLNFLVDTGAGATIVDLDVARRTGAKLTKPERVLGTNGTATAYRAKGFRGSLGGIPLPGNVLALDLSGVRASGGKRVDGLLGADFLKGHVVQIDYGRQYIRLLGRGRNQIPNGSREVRMVNRNGVWCIPVALDNGEPVLLRVDTGCHSAVEYVNQQMSTNNTRITTALSLAGMRLEGVHAGVHRRQFFPNEAGLLGNGVLSKFLVTIDPGRGRMHLAPPR